MVFQDLPLVVGIVHSPDVANLILPSTFHLIFLEPLSTFSDEFEKAQVHAFTHFCSDPPLSKHEDLPLHPWTTRTSCLTNCANKRGCASLRAKMIVSGSLTWPGNMGQEKDHDRSIADYQTTPTSVCQQLPKNLVNARGVDLVGNPEGGEVTGASEFLLQGDEDGTPYL